MKVERAKASSISKLGWRILPREEKQEAAVKSSVVMPACGLLLCSLIIGKSMQEEGGADGVTAAGPGR